MKFIIDDVDDARSVSTSRRSFLVNTAVLLGGYAVFPTSMAFAEPSPAKSLSNIHHIAEFLTAKPLDAALARRAESALTKVDSTFPTGLAQLADFISSHNLADVDALKHAQGFDGDIKSTAQKIISALYLGYAGDPVQLSSEDNVQFVTYTQALTYQLTREYTPIPSYSRWGTGYWDKLPTFS